MNTLIVPADSHPATPEQILGLLRAYRELSQGRRDAHDRGAPSRQHPHSLVALRAQDIAEDVLLWMLYQGHVEYPAPPQCRAIGRIDSRRSENSLIAHSTVFALSDAGEVFASALLAQMDSLKDVEFDFPWDVQLGRLIPGYDRAQRLFNWGKHLLKQFRQPSPSQETILQAAEELAWPTWFDDPLPRRPGINPKVHLHDTIKDLNRRQRMPLVHFKGDGTGTRVGWELRCWLPIAPPALPQIDY